MLIALLGESLVTRYVKIVTAVTETLTQGRAGQTSVARIVQCIISRETHATLLWSFGPQAIYLMLLTLLGESRVTRYVNSECHRTAHTGPGRANKCGKDSAMHHIPRDSRNVVMVIRYRPQAVTLLAESHVTRYVKSVTALTEQLTQGRAGQTSVARIMQCIMSHEFHVTLL